MWRPWVFSGSGDSDSIGRMYLRHTTRKKHGKVHRYWSLVRSVRVGRRVIQQTVAHLGELDEQGRIEARALGRHLIGAPEEALDFLSRAELKGAVITCWMGRTSTARLRSNAGSISSAVS